MAKVGIYQIAFVEQNEVDDLWHEDQPQPQQRGAGNEPIVANAHYFSCFDQGQANMDEELIDDANGTMYSLQLSFPVRKDSDIALAKKYLRRPVVMYVETVAGDHFKIGTKEYPVRMKGNNGYQGISNREMAISVTYDTLTGVLNK